MPYDTLEVRWFFDGALARSTADVETWFCGRTGIAHDGDAAGWPPGWRVDRYVLVPGAAEMGIKLREGRLEIKGRVAAFGAQTFGETGRGMTERWMKWSYPLPTTAASQHDPGAGLPFMDVGPLLPVSKRRLVRYLAIASNLPVDAPFDVSETGPIVGFELVRLRLGRSPTETHWSLALEAFPYGPDLQGSFAAAVRVLLEGWPLGPLGAEHSMSYPAWLQRAGEA